MVWNSAQLCRKKLFLCLTMRIQRLINSFLIVWHGEKGLFLIIFFQRRVDVFTMNKIEMF